MATTLPGIRACVFDAYGTLFDYASEATACRGELGDRIGPLTLLWRDKHLQYTWLRALQGRHPDFWRVTGGGLDFAMETLGLDDPLPRARRLMELYRAFDVFPEVPAMVKRLKAAGRRSAILLNGSPAMLDTAVSKAEIGGLLDAVLSAELVGGYKPHHKVYQLGVDRLAISAEAIAFQSSNAWDAHTASAFGMRVVWCNRYGQRPERLPRKPDREIASLAELPARVGA
jgi:2-haloacid dehalogenase